MNVKIQSGEYISEETLEKIKDILHNSRCPNESLKNSVENFSFFDGKTIQLSDGENFVEYVEVE